MNEFEEYEDRIERYLQGKMNDSEEEMFMQELNTNEALHKQYEQELLVRALFSSKEFKEKVSVDKQSKVVDLEASNKPVQYLPSFLSRYKYAVAAAALLIIATGVVIVKHNSVFQQISTVNVNNNKTQILKNDSLKSINPALKSDSISQALYNRYYKKYIAKNDPVEISNYYNFYKSKEYNKVIIANKTDYASMGANNRQNLLNTYMLFYKGLSYLEKDNTINAIKSFDSVLNSADENQKVYYNAQWYLSLAYLKSGNFKMASHTLYSMTQTSSSYKYLAEQMLLQLK